MCRRLGFRHVRDVTGDDGTVTKLLVISTTEAYAQDGLPSERPLEVPSHGSAQHPE
jgi:hypothetical protein